MYILSNLNIEDDLKFEITDNNDSCRFEASIDNIKIVGQERKMSCNFFVFENANDSDTVIKLRNIVPAKLIECEVVYETGIVQNDYNRTDLIRSFGSKKTIERMKTIEADGYLKTSTMKFNNKSQILPKVQGTDKLTECFLLEDMFNKDILSIFQDINFEEIDLLDDTKRFYDGTPNHRLRILLLDGLLKLVNFKFVTEDVFDNSPYSCLIDLVKEEIENRRLPKMTRDKIIIKIYILILQIQEGKVKLCSVPTFNLKVENVLEYFRLLGCVYNKNNDEIKLVAKPMEFSSKFV
ncbi:hypothetical protein P3W45_001362 [Vairimorpha bombi]|jgi:hypothetical protein